MGVNFMGVDQARGFTLIELVVGIVVFAIALTLFTALVIPQAVRSVDPIFQVRAAELGQSLINEIAGKSFDEASDRSGGAVLCSSAVAPLCTASTGLGPDGVSPNQETRANFDDVDDYHNLPVASGDIKNSLDQITTLNGTNLYAGFSLFITVVYDADMNGVADAARGNTKLITVTVTTPNDEDIVFSTFRHNY